MYKNKHWNSNTVNAYKEEKKSVRQAGRGRPCGGGEDNQGAGAGSSAGAQAQP